MRWRIILSMLLLHLLSVASAATDSRSVTVSVMRDIRPLFYLNDENEPSGIYVDLIKAIGEQRGWQVHFHPNSWSEGIEKVRNGEIDLMPGVIKTDEREAFLDFHTVPVMVSWGQVAVGEHSPIASIPDLDGKTVGIMRRDQNARNFKQLISEFHITCEFKEVNSHSEIIPLIENGEVDAGIFYSAYSFENRRVKSTSIFFNPAVGYYATGKGKNRELLIGIDEVLNIWKNDKTSPYYQILQNYISSSVVERTVMPKWILYAAGGGLAVLLLSILWIVSLNVLVKIKTLELRKSEQRFYQSLKKSPVAMGITDSDGRILFLNDRFIDCFGYTPDDIPTVSDWFDRAYPDALIRDSLRNLWVKQIEEYHTTGMFKPVEAPVVCKDGTGKIIRFNFEAVDNLNITSFNDVTEQRTIQKALREGEENYRTVADYTYDWEYWLLPDGSVKYMSPSCEGITGYDVESFKQDKELIRKIVFPDDLSVVADHYLVRERNCEHLEFRIRMKDGTVKWIAHSCRAVFGENGEYRGQRVNNRDITELKRTQEQLRQSQKMQAIGQLAGGIAHDFNNILGGIIGYADLSLGMVEKGGVVENYIRQILKAGDRAKRLVKQILTFSRQGDEEKKSIFLKPLVKEVLELLKVSIPSSVHIDLVIEPVQYSVCADSTKIHETLMNLASNAVYAMNEKGTLTVKLFERTFTESQPGRLGDITPGRYCIIEVSDTGSGMDEKTQERIFDPFFTTKPTGKGTGMGLSVVYGVCQMHNANIQVESTPDEGTTIRLFFPAETEPVSASPSLHEAYRTGRERILLVDDEPALTEVGREMLVSLGYSVTVCNSSTEALLLLREKTDAFDCLITDQTMPDLHGIDLARNAREVNSRLPVILCTGYSSTVNESVAKEAGIGCLLMKPMTKKELADAVEEVLDEKR